MILNLTENEIKRLFGIIETCKIYYEAIGDENNSEVDDCRYFQEKLGMLHSSMEHSNEIWW